MSSLYNDIPKLSYAESATAIAACVRADRTAMLMGAPGIGKTAAMAQIAAAFKKKLVTCILSNSDPTDIAGLPMLDVHGNVKLHAFPAFREAITAPCFLFLDEFTAIRRSVEAPALRLMLEHVAGGEKLHPETNVVGACNSPEHAPGGIELSAAMLNRLIWLRYEPSFEDVGGYFAALANEAIPDNVAAARAGIAGVVAVDYATSRAIELADFAATMGMKPDLVQLEPPPDAVSAGSPWASPRAWEAGLTAYAALGREATSGKNDLVGYALLAGAVGPHPAAAYLGIRDLRTQLPTAKDIIDRPKEAKVPTRDLAIAVLGVVTRVAAEDFGAACMYLERFPPEIAAAAYRSVSRRYQQNISKSKHGAKAALESFTRLSRKIGEMV